MILNIRLDGNKHSHCVAWDGKTVHDDPHSLKIYDSDRRTREASRAAFGKLYSEYAVWQIAKVYRLESRSK